MMKHYVNCNAQVHYPKFNDKFEFITINKVRDVIKNK
jgi:hypothetical protein